MDKYAISLVLREQSSSDYALQIGGSTRSNRTTNDYDQILGGSAPFPGFLAQYNGMQADAGTRYIYVRDILGIDSAGKPSSRPSRFGDDCAALFSANPTFEKLPIGEKLGIADRLELVLKELSLSPGTMQEEKMEFDFSVEVDAAGSVLFIRPVKQLSIGLGGRQKFNEKLTVTISKIPES